MIILRFAGITGQATYGQLDLGGPTLEGCLEHLSNLVADGWMLTQVSYLDTLIKKSRWIPLAHQAVDGQPMLAPISSLEKQWQAVLEESADRQDNPNEWLLAYGWQRLRRYQAHINHLEAALKGVDERSNQAWCTGGPEPDRTRLILYLERLAQRYTHQLSTTQRKQDRFICLLNQLRIW